MKLTKIDGPRTAIYVTIPGEGTIERGFRNKGEAINYLQRHYGMDWKKLRPKFNHNATRDNWDMEN